MLILSCGVQWIKYPLVTGYGMVVTLVILVLCLNALAIGLRSRVFKKLKGQ